MRTKSAAVKIFLLALLSCATAPAFASVLQGTGRCGRVLEISKVAADFIVNLTDAKHENLAKYGWPKRLTGRFDANTRDWRAHARTPCFDDVFDVRNKTVAKLAAGGGGLPAGGGGGFNVVADLSLEAVFIGDQGEFQLNNIWGAIEGHVGRSFLVRIPDLYLLENGLLVPDGTLYSMVDLNLYLHDIPSFQLGDIFTIINGANASLPGMLFSTTPFTFDPLNGFTGTPFSGAGYALAEHDLTTSVAEPSTFVLMCLGLVALVAMREWQRKRNA